MQRAVPVGEGAMAALLGLDSRPRGPSPPGGLRGIDKARSATGQRQWRRPGGGQRPQGAVERAIAIAAERGARRSIMLPVSAPFHCALMAPAAREMAEALAAVELREPWVPLVANVSAAPVAIPTRSSACWSSR